jgi:hypothetical protein
MRREREITIAGPGRDQGKTFRIREMTPAQAERWTLRAVLAAGIEEEIDGWSALKALMLVNFEAAVPLLDEMMSCVTFKTGPDTSRALLPDDIEEPTTMFVLRMMVVQLHENPKAPPFQEKIVAHGHVYH